MKNVILVIVGILLIPLAYYLAHLYQGFSRYAILVALPGWFLAGWNLIIIEKRVHKR